MATTQTFKKLPAVLSFQRGFLITDAPFYNLLEGVESEESFRGAPVSIMRHGIRATQNIADDKATDDGNGDATTEKAAERSVANVQTTESAKLRHDAVGLVTEFSIRPLALEKTLHACASSNPEVRRAMRESIEDFCRRAVESGATLELAKRYARNILNGRWLWRNRVVAESIRIDVFFKKSLIVSTDAFSIGYDDFEDTTESELKVAELLNKGISGDRDTTLLVRASLTFGTWGVLEVYPSQNYVDKSRGYARSLYKLPGSKVKVDRQAIPDTIDLGTAALRDQKIGNAIRTVDTWYDDYDAIRRPIPVEPKGASLELMEFFRTGKSSAFKLLCRLAEIDPNSEEGLFIIAVMLRGGVFGESEKDLPTNDEGKAA